MVANELKRPVQMAAGFVMDADPVRPGLGEVGDEDVGVLDHQVAVEGEVGRLAKGFEHRKAKREVGHKMAVHHIDVDDLRATPLGGGNIAAEVGEVGGEDGWKYFNHGWTPWGEVYQLAVAAKATGRSGPA